MYRRKRLLSLEDDETTQHHNSTQSDQVEDYFFIEEEKKKLKNLSNNNNNTINNIQLTQFSLLPGINEYDSDNETEEEKKANENPIVSSTTNDKNNSLTNQINNNINNTHFPSSSSSSSIQSTVLSSSSSSSLSSLPLNWSECIDESSGDKYYWNIETNETSWIKPINNNSIDTNNTTNTAIDTNISLPISSTTVSTSSTTVVPSSPLSTSSSIDSQLSLISALFAGLHSRLRGALSSSSCCACATELRNTINSNITPTDSNNILPLSINLNSKSHLLTPFCTLKDSISPLVNIIIELEIREKDWQESLLQIQLPTPSQSELILNEYIIKQTLKSLQLITININDIEKKEKEWREDIHTNSQINRMTKLVMDNQSNNNNTSSSSNTTSSTAGTTTLLTTVFPTTSGFIHPDRIGVINHPTTSNTSSSSSSSNITTANSLQTKRSRSPLTENQNDSNYHSNSNNNNNTKKYKSNTPLMINKQMNSLLSKWKQAESTL